MKYRDKSYKYPLVQGTITHNDIDALIEWLKTYPRLTKHKLNDEFECKFAEWLGTKYSIFVNSGSSANLLMLSALDEAEYIMNRKIVVPAVSWATDLAPVVQLHMTPIMCDCNMDDLSIDLNHFEHICKTEHPDVLLLVSVLGLVPDMFLIQQLCQKYGVTLLEDCCEATGSKYCDKKLGTFGLMSSFSGYYGHHFSTIESGVIATNDRRLMNIIKSQRAHGWTRDCDKEFQKEQKDKWHISDFQDLYTFFTFGYNMRNTDLHAFLGLRQLTHLDKFIKQRNKNYLSYHKYLAGGIWKPQLDNMHEYVSNFAYPLIINDRNEFAKYLNNYDVECRPLIAGSLARQPFFIKRFRVRVLPNADKVHNFGIYLPNNHDMTENDIAAICSIINDYAGE